MVQRERWLALESAPVPDDVARILTGLPEWFGIEAANAEYVEAARTKETWTVRDDSDTVIGAMLVDRHFPQTAEIHLLLVERAHHGTGVGSALVEALEERLRRDGVQLLEVKTLGPSHPDPGYARTRHFYEKMGFLPLEVTDLWGEHNPCLIMVKPLRSFAGHIASQKD